jgi:hypothetical protein
MVVLTKRISLAVCKQKQSKQAEETMQVLRSQLLEKEREIKHLKVSDDETFLLLYLPRESLLRPISWLTTRASAHSSPVRVA